MFKWTCFAAAVLATLAFGWMLNDVRMDLKRTKAMIDEKLPPILENGKRSSETLADVAGDLKQLRDLAGISRVDRDDTLTAYADGVLECIAGSGGRIGMEKLIGKSLDEPVAAAEWVVSARKVAMVDVFRARSRADVLRLICTNWRRGDWHIQIGGETPVKLADWVKANHPESAELK